MLHRIAAVQMTSTQDIQENLATAKKWVKEAAHQGAKLVVLPEMFALMAMDQMEKIKAAELFGKGVIQDFLADLAKQNKIWLVAGTIPILVDSASHKAHAACLVFNEEGQLMGRYDKIHLFDVDLAGTSESYQESKVITAGKNLTVIKTPFGKLGIAVCYDIRFPEMFRLMHEQGVEIVALPAAFTFTTGSVHWDILVRARAIENQVYMIAAGQTGVHPNNRKTYGHSMIVDPWGAIKASLPVEQGIIVADIDLNFLKKMRSEFPVLSHRRL
jgi:predicted amidohydrolase